MSLVVLLMKMKELEEVVVVVKTACVVGVDDVNRYPSMMAISVVIVAADDVQMMAVMPDVVEQW